MGVSPSGAVRALSLSQYDSPTATHGTEMKNMAPNPFPRLSEELYVRIFSFVAASDLGRQAAVSRRWCAVSAEKSLWRALCAQSKVNVSREPKIGWKQKYVEAVVKKPKRVIAHTHTSVYGDSDHYKLYGPYTPGPYF
ncbi:MAG: hypothetical protein S4CHLAM2_06690 [Chlamydiales bacterium]|nr:hypothetical protein [Chlamydiales bacterium]